MFRLAEPNRLTRNNTRKTCSLFTSLKCLPPMQLKTFRWLLYFLLKSITLASLADLLRATFPLFIEFFMLPEEPIGFCNYLGSLCKCHYTNVHLFCCFSLSRAPQHAICNFNYLFCCRIQNTTPRAPSKSQRSTNYCERLRVRISQEQINLSINLLVFLKLFVTRLETDPDMKFKLVT